MIKDSELELITAAELDAAVDHVAVTDASAGSAGTKRMLLSQWIVWIKSFLGGAAVLNVGTGAGTVAAGDDSRLSNARTPTAHASTHASGQSDPIKLDDLAAPDDNTDLDVSTSRHGLVPKAPNDTQKYLRGDGTWAVPTVAEPFKVGSIYMNVTGVNPATELGYGTWSAFGAGRFPVGFSTGDADFDPVENTGGSKTVALTEAQLPAHTHVLTVEEDFDLNDPGHTHTDTFAVNDPGHSHDVTVTDPGHTHTSDQGSSQLLTTANGDPIDVPVSGVTGSSTTGITAGADMALADVTLDGAVQSNTTGTTLTGGITTAAAANTGSGQAHDNLPPFIVVHMWKRTA